MLKPADPMPEPEERPIGDIVGDLVDEGKAFARAELDLAKAMAAAKALALRTPIILLVVAAVVAMGAVNALCVAIFFALTTLMGPLLAGVTTFILVGALAALLAWLGVEKLRSAE